MPTGVIKVTGGQRWKAVLARVAAQKVGVKAGIFGGATTIDGQSIVEYAIYNEFGTSRIPARPFMRQTVEKNKAQWLATLEEALRRNPADAEGAMYILGETMRADIANEIEHGSFRPNSPKTVTAKARKGKVDPDHPLIDTGQMLQAVAYEVVKE